MAATAPPPPPPPDEVIMEYLAGLSPQTFYDLTHSLATDLRFHHQRLLSLLLSSVHFSTTLSFLHSLTLPEKTLLLARYLLRSLRLLLSGGGGGALESTPGLPRPLRLPEFDAAFLLLTMCEVCEKRKKGEEEHGWRTMIAGQVLRSTLSPAGLGGIKDIWWVVSFYVDSATKCRRLLDAIAGEGGRRKAERRVGASVAAVVALESVEVGDGEDDKINWSCAICREEMREKGREVCRMPCGHFFHWMCVLPWLRKNNTCPCCRFELPTDDVFFEIDRLWRRAAAATSISQSN